MSPLSEKRGRRFPMTAEARHRSEVVDDEQVFVGQAIALRVSLTKRITSVTTCHQLSRGPCRHRRSEAAKDSYALTWALRPTSSSSPTFAGGRLRHALLGAVDRGQLGVEVLKGQLHVDRRGVRGRPPAARPAASAPPRPRPATSAPPGAAAPSPAGGAPGGSPASARAGASSSPAGHRSQTSVEACSGASAVPGAERPWCVPGRPWQGQRPTTCRAFNEWLGLGPPHS